MDIPLVSVVMPVYNAERFLDQSVESILNQTFRDFELIIVDDGSVDRSKELIAEYAKNDRRVHVHTHEVNKGLVASLNQGCQLAKGKYIARMDADDISVAHRFRCQLEYLETHLEVGVLGSWIEYIDPQGKVTGTIRYPVLPGLVKWILPFYCPLAHPAVIMRREAIAPLGFYREGKLVVEDYDLWVRASRITELANIPEVLLRYRVWGESWSARNTNIQEQNADQVAADIVGDWVENIHISTIHQLRAFAADQFPQSGTDMHALGDLIMRMHGSYCQGEVLSVEERHAVNQDAANKLFVLASQMRKYSIPDTIRLIVRALQISPLTISQIRRGILRLRAKNRGSFQRTRSNSS